MDESILANAVARLQDWRHTRNHLTIGNVGEHVTGRLLVDLGYQLLGAQDDFVGMVADVVGESTRANPEDFIVVDLDGRLTTVNSKASVSPRACRLTASGDLSPPRISRRQREVHYSSERAGLISPLHGDTFTRVAKVDLLHMKAQLFDVGDALAVARKGPPHDVTGIVVAVLAEFPDAVPPPNIWDLI